VAVFLKEAVDLRFTEEGKFDLTGATDVMAALYKASYAPSLKWWTPK
jgi:hypothetical protein